MQIRSTIVAIIVAAAAGGAAVRAFGLRGAADVAVPVTGDRRSAASFETTQPADARKALPATRAFASRAASGATAVVYVAGAVARPGVYELPASARANDALRRAGGPAPNADLVAVNLAARIADGDEIAVPLRGATASGGGDGGARVSRRRRAPRARSGASGSTLHRRRKKRTGEAAGAAGAADAADAPTELIDINAATEDELETLPGVGPALAERIVAFRDLNGPFASSDELLDVGGMTAAKVDALAPYASFR